MVFWLLKTRSTSWRRIVSVSTGCPGTCPAAVTGMWPWKFCSETNVTNNAAVATNMTTTNAVCYTKKSNVVEPTSCDFSSRTSCEWYFFISLSLPSLYGHRVVTGHGQLGENDVVDVLCSRVWAQAILFWLSSRRQLSLFCLSLAGEAARVYHTCNLWTYCEGMFGVCLWVSMVLRPSALQLSCGYMTNGNRARGQETVSFGYFVYITFVNVFS
jgi:hypothetical protein